MYVNTNKIFLFLYIADLNHHDKVFSMLGDITNWYKLGQKLGLKIPTLERIEHDHSRANRCLSEVVNAWLRKRDGITTTSVRSMVAALWKMDEKATAQKIS